MLRTITEEWDAFEGLSGLHIVDDIITYDKDKTSHMKHVKQFLQRCKQRQEGKAQVQVTFAGLQLLCSYTETTWVVCYSDWPIIAPMHNTTANNRHLLAMCTEILDQTAVPHVLWMERVHNLPVRCSKILASMGDPTQMINPTLSSKQWDYYGRHNRKSYE